MRKFALVGLLAAASAQPGIAVAQDDPACAKFEDPLAYNACLAARGPKATDVATYDGQAAPAKAAPVQASPAPLTRTYAPSARGRYAWSASRRRGRLHMEFRVK